MPPDGLIRYLHAVYAAPDDGVSDADLLRRCAAKEDDAAFELLTRRHAEMVWRVCRSVARDHHMAEDAFQATFLALSRKAGSVRGSVPGWLYRVAYHAALKARARQMRADRPTDPVPDCPVAGDSIGAAERAELAGVLHDELSRLGDSYRLPLLLCYLEGYSHDEAAKALGWPVGTVATRIARGRDRLRDRLTRRGVALPAGGVVAALSAGPVSALPPFLAALTARAIGSGNPSPFVHHLAAGVLAAMARPKKFFLLASAVAITLAVGAAVTLGGKKVDPPPPSPEAPPDPPKVPEKGGPINAVVLGHSASGFLLQVARFHEPEQLAALEQCFPDYKKRPASNVAGGWKLGYEVYFNFPHGNTVRVTVSGGDNRQAVWSVGRGTSRWPATSTSSWKPPRATRPIRSGADPPGGRAW